MGSDQAIRRTIVLNLTIFAACLLCTDTTSGLSFRCLTAPLLTAFLISWPTAYIPSPFRSVIQLFIGELLLILCLIDAYCQEMFATPITPQVLSNALLSDARETREFISTFLDFHVISHWRIAMLFLITLALPVDLFFSHQCSVCCRLGHKTWGVTLLICIICEALPTYRFAQLFCQNRDMQNIEGLIFRQYHKEIPTPLHRIAFAYYSLNQSSHVLDYIKKSTFSAHIDSCSYQSPHIVLVIGESYNKHHSTLYGYPLPTTPLQHQRKEDGQLFVFTDAVTPWNITSNVFLDIFSLWEYGMKEAIHNIPLFPILFKRAGYSVNFFSNQYLLKGFRKGATNQAGHFFLADTQMSDTLFTFRNKRSSKYDLGLISQIEHFKAEQPKQPLTLDIIHLVGQHFDYSLRCPEQNKVFRMENYIDRKLDEEAKTIIMQYDNATYYNDIVLDSILTLYEHEESIVLFVADHGEEVYDELPIHGRLFQEPTATQARYEFEVPMWIWCSKSYRTHHPETVFAIQTSTHKPFLTDGTSQILLSLAGIRCNWTDERHNILSPDYQPKPRIICGNFDYDHTKK